MAGRFSKNAAPYTARNINGNNQNGDSVIGGSITASPGNMSQFQQNSPGDRFIFSTADAIAICNNAVANLYNGTYRYVASRNNSTSVPQRGRAAFWDLSAIPGAGNISSYQGDELYQVTSDENTANILQSMFAGVYINNFAAGNYWFIQESGKASCWFRGNNGSVLYGAANITGTPAIGIGVYLAAVGNNANANTGLFDQLSGATFNAAFSANVANNAVAGNAAVPYLNIDNMFVRYVGVAETLASNGNISLVDLTLSRASFRW